MWSGDRSLNACAVRLRQLGDALRARRGWLAAWVAAGAIVALAYALSVPAQFVARVDIEIAPRSLANDGPEDVRHFHQVDLDSEQAATELQVFKSEGLLRPVFESLELAKSPELSERRDGAWSMLSHVLHEVSPDEFPYAERDRAFLAFVDRVRCLRIGLSYVFEISYRSHDPALAARVANAIAAQYLADRVARERLRVARMGAAYRAARWEGLTHQWLVSRAAAAAGVTPDEDLYAAAARVLGPATAPLNKSYPKMGPTLAFGAGLGLLFGLLTIVGLDPLSPVRATRPGDERLHARDAASEAAENTSSSKG